MAPTYRIQYFEGYPVGGAMTCSLCGALVMDQDAHTRFHERIDRTETLAKS